MGSKWTVQMSGDVRIVHFILETGNLYKNGLVRFITLFQNLIGRTYATQSENTFLSSEPFLIIS